jgi:hypothetical protein
MGTASCVWWRGVGVGWGYEIWCVLSREGDVVAWVLRLVYGGGGWGWGWMGVGDVVFVE